MHSLESGFFSLFCELFLCPVLLKFFLLHCCILFHHVTVPEFMHSLMNICMFPSVLVLAVNILGHVTFLLALCLQGELLFLGLACVQLWQIASHSLPK